MTDPESLRLRFALRGTVGHHPTVFQVWSSLGKRGYGNHVLPNIHLRPAPANEQLLEGVLEVPVEEGVEQGVDGGVAVSQPGDDLEGAEQHRAGGVAASGRQPNIEHEVGQPAEHEH